MPERKVFNADSSVIRQIDIDAPVIHGASKIGLRRLKEEKVWIDKSHHTDTRIKQYT